MKTTTKRTRTYGYTAHDVARKAAEKGWKPFDSRESYYSHLRSKTKQELPKEAK
jgi:hypothetical protein